MLYHVDYIIPAECDAMDHTVGLDNTQSLGESMSSDCPWGDVIHTLGKIQKYTLSLCVGGAGFRLTPGQAPGTYYLCLRVSVLAPYYDHDGGCVLLTQ